MVPPAPENQQLTPAVLISLSISIKNFLSPKWLSSFNSSMHEPFQRMEKMEVQIISRETIKPSSPTVVHKRKPYKFSLFNQLTPSTYSPLIFFYTNSNVGDDEEFQKSHLKKSLSEALNFYYPISGRIRDNIYIDGFDQGVPFFEAKASCRMADFLKHHEIESLNRLLPYQPYSKLDINSPLLAIQTTTFTCGGMAIGVAASHKIIDALSGKAFLDCLTSISRGCYNEIVVPELNEPSLVFPPRESLPSSHLSLMESLWFTEANYVTRRFVFDAKAIAALREKARGQLEARPSRVETLTCFIWKCFMDASKLASNGASRPSILVEAVNLRTRTKPPTSNASIGNVFWWATAVSNPNDANNDLHDLVGCLNEAIALFDGDYTESLQGEEGYETISSYCEQLEGLFAMEKPDIFAFTSWCYLGFTKVNFGWGDPFWVGILGKAGPAFRNLTNLIETKDGKGIEAWVTLDAQRMAILERHPELLRFASPNPRISSL